MDKQQVTRRISFSSLAFTALCAFFADCIAFFAQLNVVPKVRARKCQMLDLNSHRAGGSLSRVRLHCRSSKPRRPLKPHKGTGEKSSTGQVPAPPPHRACCVLLARNPGPTH